MAQDDINYFTQVPEHMTLLIQGITKKLAASEYPNGVPAGAKQHLQAEVEQKLSKTLSDPNLLKQARTEVEQEELRLHPVQTQPQSPRAVEQLPEEVRRQAKEAAASVQGAASNGPTVDIRLLKDKKLIHDDRYTNAYKQSFTQIFTDIENQARREFPGKKMADEIHINVIENKYPQMFSETRMENGKPIMVMTMTTGELEMLSKAGNNSQGMAKNGFAHEFVHHLRFLNPEIDKDPRLNPSQQVLNELNALKKDGFPPTDEQVAKARAEAAAKNVPFSEEKFRQDTISQKEFVYMQEARTDKGALWITKDLENAQNYRRASQEAVKAANGNKPLTLKEEIGASTMMPHPSDGVRETENIVTAAAINNARLQQQQRGR